ncbi:hypothetical protein ET33_26085 [Paenibacillus tyrfis]|uniref:Uncharacterized protein n=1 Tax=Paenibacillus tyrfis TaxID=1501230 RepID=A0A081P9G3_9BACL|nr:hypothetical protein ET33_26085 [Paenibacillus tyrfis]
MMFEMEQADFKQPASHFMELFLPGVYEGQMFCGVFRCVRELASAFKIQEGLRENIRSSPPSM